MGRQPKALLSGAALGETRSFLEMISHTAREAGVAGVAIVLGYHGDHVESLASERCDIVVRNPTPELGMGSSARVLANALPREAAMLLWPVDIPHVRSKTIQSIVSTSLKNQARIIIPTYRKRGHPPLLPPRVVEALRRMPAQERLDRFLEAEGGEPMILSVDDPAIEQDFDSPEDFENYRKQGTLSTSG